MGEIATLFGGRSASKGAAGAVVDSNGMAIEEQRKNLAQTRADLMPYMMGSQFLDQLGAGASFGGFASNLNEIMGSPVFDELRKKRLDGINASFGANGMLNSGGRAKAIASDMSDLGMALEQLIYGRQSGLADMGFSAANALGGFGTSAAGNISNLISGQGQARASGILGAQQEKAAGINQLFAAGAAIFSDSRLKENITKVGEVGPLNVYEWDWIPEMKELGIEPEMRRGFIAEEVQALFPRFVHKVGNFLAVDYEGLFDRLEEVLA